MPPRISQTEVRIAAARKTLRLCDSSIIGGTRSAHARAAMMIDGSASDVWSGLKLVVRKHLR
jgi:hypothetical protein